MPANDLSNDDGSKAADCLSAIFARGCTITEQLAPVSSQACDDTFKGSVATGGTCFSEEECVSQSCDRSNCATALTCCARRARHGPFYLFGH